jgi:hypothetical protein
MTEQRPEPARALRECDACHVTDDLGHHQVAVPDENGQLAVESRHFRCCAAAGCPDQSCNAILTGAPGV